VHTASAQSQNVKTMKLSSFCLSHDKFLVFCIEKLRAFDSRDDDHMHDEHDGKDGNEDAVPGWL